MKQHWFYHCCVVHTTNLCSLWPYSTKKQKSYKQNNGFIIKHNPGMPGMWPGEPKHFQAKPDRLISLYVNLGMFDSTVFRSEETWGTLRDNRSFTLHREVRNPKTNRNWGTTYFSAMLANNYHSWCDRDAMSISENTRHQANSIHGGKHILTKSNLSSTISRKTQLKCPCLTHCIQVLMQ